MKSKALIATTALILALSAVSCGKEDDESSVSISYGESTKATSAVDNTEDDEKEEATAEQTTTAMTATEISGTETATSGTETQPAETTATETSAVEEETTTAVPAETTAPPATEAPADTTPEDNTSAPDNSENNNDNSQPEEPQSTQAPEPVTEEQTENNTFDFKFTTDNLLNDASGLIAMLGTPNDSFAAPGCTTNGNDVKCYQYDGLEIQCYIDGATEYIFSIEMKSDRYETDKGIRTGSSRGDVESAYGTGETSGNMTVYYTGNNEMDIEYEGDTVKSIFFYAPV